MNHHQYHRVNKTKNNSMKHNQKISPAKINQNNLLKNNKKNISKSTNKNRLSPNQ